MMWKSMHRMSQDFIELQTKHKVSAYRTPSAILDAQLKAWDGVIAKRSAENPLFVKVDRVAEGLGTARDVLAQQHAGGSARGIRALLPEGPAARRLIAPPTHLLPAAPLGLSYPPLLLRSPPTPPPLLHRSGANWAKNWPVSFREVEFG